MPLPTAPPGLAGTRAALHRVAEEVVSARRLEATGNEIALTVRAGGFATPDLPDGGWVGVSGVDLLITDATGETRLHPLSSLRDAGRAAGLREPDALDDAPLGVDPAAAAFLSTVYVLAAEALGVLHAEARPQWDPSPVRLWPEHFDIAFDQGAEAGGARAGYGVSPGDDEHPEPYAYAGPWASPPPGDAALWNATGFTGAQLEWAALAAAADPVAELLRFWRARRDVLVGS